MAKKTKLTVGLRNSIKASIIADVPTVAYHSLIQDYLNQKAKEQLPVELQDGRFAEYLGNAYVKEFGKYVPNPCFKPTDEDRDFVTLQRNLDFEQQENLRIARLSVEAMLENFNYVEDFVAAAPKFAEYVPKPEEPIVNLPAVQLKEQLTALGWPKSDEGK